MQNSDHQLDGYLSQIKMAGLMNRSDQRELLEEVEIVVPIFNAPEAVERCISSLINHTSSKHRITLLDDASSDPKLIEYCRTITQEHAHISLIQRACNLGYLHNVNSYLAETEHAVVLLNSDTQVTAGWLTAMLNVASDSTVGCVCPLSDNATILSMPERLIDHIEHLQALDKSWFSLPTAVGFCLLIKPSWWKKLNGFDPFFNPGYGEECDFSMRLRMQGRQIACAPAAFVFHQASQSFGQQSHQLQTQHQMLLDLRWPSYQREIKIFQAKSPVSLVAQWLTATIQVRPRILHVVHGIDSKGGVELFTRKLLEKFDNQYNHSVLIPQRQDHHKPPSSDLLEAMVIELNRDAFKTDHRIFNQPADLYQKELDIYFKHLVAWGKFAHVHFHSTVGIGTAVWPQICFQLGVSYDMFLHDHSALCQIFSLSTTTHNQEIYCGKTFVEPNTKQCQNCLTDKTQKSKLTTESYLGLRTKIWHENINNAAQIQVCSGYLKSIILAKYSGIENKTTVINPDFQNSQTTATKPLVDKPAEVAFLGQFGILKGAQLFIDLYHQLANENINWQIIGGLDSRYQTQLSNTNIATDGSYHQQDLGRLLAAVDVIVFTSQIPETYGLTLTEAMVHGIPVVAPDLGVYPHRVKDGKQGLIYQAGNLKSLTAAVTKLLAKQRSKKPIQALTFSTTQSNINQQLNKHYQSTINTHHPALLQNTKRAPLQPAPMNGAMQIMQDWLDAPRTLEAARDWLVAPSHFPVIVIGSDSHAISQTKKILHQHIKQAQITVVRDDTSLNTPDLDVVLLIKAGCYINENFGNWLADFIASDAILSLADFALHDRAGTSYAPQFMGHFSKQNLAATGYNIGALLWKPKRPQKHLTQSQPEPLIGLKSLLQRCLKSAANQVAYFPYFSYTMLDQIFASHWKSTTPKIAVNEAKLPTAVWVLLASNLTGNDLEQVTSKLLKQTLFTDNRAQLLCFSGPNKAPINAIKPAGDEVIVMLADNIFMPQTDCLEQAVLRLQAEHLDGLSMAAARDANGQMLIGKKSGGGNHFQAVGQIKDLRFNQPRMAYEHEWLDDDFWLLTAAAWHSVAAVFLADDSYFTALKISQHLQRSGFHIGLMTDQSIRKSGLPSLHSKQYLQNLNEQRKAIITANLQHPVRSFYPKAYSCRLACQLDIVTTSFKTPKRLPRVVAYAQDDWASGFYRIKSPLNALAAANHLSVHFISANKQQDVPTPYEIHRLEADVLLLHGFYSDQQLATLHQYKQQLNAQIIISMDDLLMSIPDYSPAKQNIPADIATRVKLACSLADKLLVSTKELASQTQHLHHNITTIPNRMTRQLWPIKLAPKKQHHKLRVGWAGAGQHRGDLAFLAQIVERTDDFCDWVFFGDHPEGLDHDSFEYHPPVAFLEYPKKLQSLHLDLAVAPLLDNPFNHCKSALKLLEYGALGIPTLASDLTPYQNSPATLVNNDIGNWVKHIQRFAQHRQLLSEHGQSLHHWVQQHWLEDHLADWLDLLCLDQ